MIDPNDSYDPRQFDILITDVIAEDIHENIPKELNVKYLADAPKELDQDITGVMFGRNLRLFCAMTVKAKDKVKMVIFLVDTGSPTTFISEEVFHSFGIMISNPMSGYTHININKRDTRVMTSHSHFKDICVIGMDFLHENKIGLHAFCENDTFFLKFNELEKKGVTSNITLEVMVGAIVGSLIVGGFFLYKRNKDKRNINNATLVPYSSERRRMEVGKLIKRGFMPSSFYNNANLCILLLYLLSWLGF